MRATASDQRIASVMSCVKLSVPSAMRAPACFSFGVGAIAPPVALPFGTWATVMPDAAMPRDVVVGEIDAVRGNQFVGQQADALEQLRRGAAAALGDDRVFQLALRQMGPDVQPGLARETGDLAEQLIRACVGRVRRERHMRAPAPSVVVLLHQFARRRNAGARRSPDHGARRLHARA